MRNFRSSWADDYFTRRNRVHAAQLKKGNIKAVAKAISERLDTVQGSVKVDATSITWTRTLIDEETFTLHLGEWLIMNVGFEILSSRDFKAKYEQTFYMSSTYTPTENEVKILNALSSDELYYGYDYICARAEISQPEAKEAIDKLRFMGVVDFARGLMNDDGEVCGSGFGIKSDTRREALLYRYYLNRGETPE